MEKSHKIAQIYGYSFCLATIIAFLICLGSLVNAIVELNNPLPFRFYFENAPNLASFETYKMDVLKSLQQKEQQYSVPLYVLPDDQTLREMYEATKADAIRHNQLQSYSSLMVNGLLLMVCIILFVLHWIWVRRLTRAEA